MADTGFVTPATFTSVQNTVGDIAWSNPSNAGASDNTYATSTVSSSGFTEELQGTNADLSAIGDSDTIDGVEVTVERRTGAGGASVFIDDLVQLIISGSGAGADRSSATAWNTTEVTITYGSPTDLWGNVLTPAIVKASNFGALVRAQRDGGSGQTAQVDHMQIRVYFTPGAGGDIAVFRRRIEGYR